jgi:hypothetical protein
MSKSTHELDSKFLQRACVQFSAQMSDTHPQPEIANATAFIRKHVEGHHREIVMALVWRVAESEGVRAQHKSAGNSDRLGAWFLLDSVVRLAQKECSDKAAAAAAKRPFIALLDGLSAFVVALARAAWEEAASSRVAPGYAAIRRGWARLFRASLAAELQLAYAAVAHDGPAVDALLVIPAEGRRKIEECLWKLRRQAPRPSGALFVADCWDMTDAKLHAFVARGAARAPDVHPRVVEWMSKLATCGYCVECDTWKHPGLRCPNSLACIEAGAIKDELVAATVLRSVGCEAVLAGDAGAAGKGRVLDAVVKRIGNDQPFEPILAAYDFVRGEPTTPAERSALFIHASYNILPGATVFGAQAATAVERARQHLRGLRRHTELERVEQAVTTLQVGFNGVVSHELEDAIHVVRRERLFLFEPLGLTEKKARRLRDGEAEPFPFDAAAAPRNKYVQKLHVVARRLCRQCLSTNHAAARCTDDGDQADPKERQRGELWDHYVARIVLDGNPAGSLLGIRLGKDDDHKVEAALGDANGAAAKTRIHMALEVLCKNDVPYCQNCHLYGHGTKKCVATHSRVLHFHGVSEVDARMDSGFLRAAHEQLRQQGPAMLTDGASELERAEELRDELRRVEECMEYYQAQAFPRRYFRAAQALNGYAQQSGAPLNLAAAKFLPQRAAAYAAAHGLHHLLDAIHTAAEKGFPAVSLFLSAPGGTLERMPLTDPAKASMAAFLGELQARHVTLEEYAVGGTAAALGVRQEFERLQQLGVADHRVNGFHMVGGKLEQLRQQLDARNAIVDPAANAMTQSMSQLDAPAVGHAAKTMLDDLLLADELLALPHEGGHAGGGSPLLELPAPTSAGRRTEHSGEEAAGAPLTAKSNGDARPRADEWHDDGLPPMKQHRTEDVESAAA